jgi:hypothetical protein
MRVWLVGVVVAVGLTGWWLWPQAPVKINNKPFGGDFWALRVAYPAMRFSPAWYVDAKAEDARVLSAQPAGDYSRFFASRSLSPLGLTPEAWTQLGPAPLQNGGYGMVSGRINDIVVDPNGPDALGHHTVYVASDGGGVWKSSNCCGADTTWSVTTDQPDIASAAIGDLHIDPNDSNVIYAGTGDLRYGSFSFGASGLLRSSDAGASWQVLGEELFNPLYPPSTTLGFPQYQAIGKVAVDPGNSDLVVVGTKTGLYFSYNAGADWSGPCFTNPHDSQRQDITGLLAVDRGEQGRWLYAAVGTRGNPTTVQPDLANLGANGIYRSAMPSAGCPALAEWTLLDSGWPAGTANGNPTGKVLGRIELAIAPGNPEVIYAMGSHATANNVLGVWRSADGGDSWTQTATGTSVQANGCSNAANGGGQMWYDAHLSVDPNDPDTVMLSGVDLYRSRNGGVTFQNISCGYGNGNVHVDHHATAYLPAAGGGSNSDALLVGTDGGVYVTSNALFGSGGTSAASRPTYLSLNATLAAIEFYSGDISANFAESAQPGASGGAQDNGSSYARWPSGTPGPVSWTVRNGGDGIHTRIEPVNEQRWYWSSQNGNITVSPNGPDSQTQLATPQTSPAWGGDTLSFVMPFELYRHGELDVAGSGCSSAVGCTYMVAGTTRVWETLQGGIPRSSWYPSSPNLTKGTLGNRSFINQLSHAVKTPSVVIAGTNDGNVWVGHGLNQGASGSPDWRNLTGANAVLPNRPVMDVTIDVIDAAAPAAGAVGYAALGGFDQNTPTTPGHIYQLTCSSGCSSFAWRNISGNLPNIPANSVAFNPNQPAQVFAGTDWGLYYTDDAFADSPKWFRFDNGLPRVMIWDMVIDRGFSTLAVFTRGRGAWAWPLPGAVRASSVFSDGFE